MSEAEPEEVSPENLLKLQWLALHKSRLDIVDALDVMKVWNSFGFSEEDRENFRIILNRKGDIEAANLLLSILEAKKPEQGWWERLLKDVGLKEIHVRKLEDRLKEVKEDYKIHGGDLFLMKEHYGEVEQPGQEVRENIVTFKLASCFARSAIVARTFIQAPEGPKLSFEFKVRGTQSKSHPDKASLGEQALKIIDTADLENVVRHLRTWKQTTTYGTRDTDDAKPKGKGTTEAYKYATVEFDLLTSSKDELIDLYKAICSGRRLLTPRYEKALNERTRTVGAGWEYTYNAAYLKNAVLVEPQEVRRVKHPETELRRQLPALQQHWKLDDTTVDKLKSEMIISEDEKNLLKRISGKQRSDRVTLLVVLFEAPKRLVTDTKFALANLDTYILRLGIEHSKQTVEPTDVIDDMRETVTAYKSGKTQEKEESRKQLKKARVQKEEKQKLLKRAKLKLRPRKFAKVMKPAEIKKLRDEDAEKAAAKFIDRRKSKRKKLYDAEIKKGAEKQVITIEIHIEDTEKEDEVLVIMKKHKDELLPFDGVRVVDIRKGSIITEAEFNSLTTMYDISDDIMSGSASDRVQKICKNEGADVSVKMSVDQAGFVDAREKFLGTSDENLRRLRETFAKPQESEGAMEPGNLVVDVSWLAGLEQFYKGHTRDSPGEITASFRETAAFRLEENRVYSFGVETLETLRSTFGVEASLMYMRVNDKDCMFEARDKAVEEDATGSILIRRFQTVRFRIRQHDQDEVVRDAWVNLDRPLIEVLGDLNLFSSVPMTVRDATDDQTTLGMSSTLRDWAESCESSALIVTLPVLENVSEL